MAAVFNHWKIGGVVTFGSGRPFETRVTGDPNQDSKFPERPAAGSGAQRLGRSNYSTMDLRLGRQIRLGTRTKLELLAESFNLFNHLNRRVQLTDHGFLNTAVQFLPFEK